jgi:hypothetical protein
MPLKTGTYTLEDLSRMNNTTVAEFGVDQIVPALQQELATHNENTVSAMSVVSSQSTEREEAWGGASDGEFQEVDDFGRVETQKPGEPSSVAYPLGKYQFSAGWTNEFMITTSPAAMVAKQLNAQNRDFANLKKLFRNRIFSPTNKTVRDTLVDGRQLVVRALLNGDGANIPVGEDGQGFPGSHTHYLASGSFSITEFDNLIKTVVEHGHGQDLQIHISQAQEAAVRGFAGFTALLDARITGANTQNQAQGALDVTRMNNRIIGYYGGASVWVKDYIFPNYVFCFAAGDPRKPLKRRVSTFSALQGLVLAGQNSPHPLYAEFFERRVGFGAATRTNGAVLYIGGSTYVDPTSGGLATSQ